MAKTPLQSREIADQALAPGLLKMHTGSSAPSGWLLCDGSTLDATANPEYLPLFNAIGTTFGGTGQSDFNLPDLRGEFPRGADDMGTGARGADASSGRAMGNAQGEATRQNGLTVSAGSLVTDNHGHGTSGGVSLSGNTSPANGSHDHSGGPLWAAVDGSSGFIFLRQNSNNFTATRRYGITGDDPSSNSRGNATNVHGSTSSDSQNSGISASHNISVDGNNASISGSPALGAGDAETRPRNLALNFIIKV